MSFPQMPQMPQVPQQPATNFNNPNQPGNSDAGQNYNNRASSTEQQKLQRSVARGRKNAGALRAAIQTRSQREQWLKQFGLQLLTSSIELQLSRDFINSSLVSYPNGVRVPLAIFLKQADPVISDIANQINQNMLGIASNLEITNPNQY